MTTGNNPPDATDRAPADQSAIGQIRVEAIQGALNGMIDIVDSEFGVGNASSRLGKGYAFTPAQLDNLAVRAQEQIDQLNSSASRAEQIARQDLRPALDPAGSGAQADAVQVSYANLETRIRSQRGYLVSWHAALSKAKQKYMAQEHLTEDQWHRLANRREA
jgi:hypothetical protein